MQFYLSYKIFISGSATFIEMDIKCKTSQFMILEVFISEPYEISLNKTGEAFLFRTVKSRWLYWEGII